MAKVLIADDNSNIQKMVVLALKDQGIDVVAVGNGEAAVRKINDLRPDLVLADVFMPVRNGYEVCKFVKDNAALSHVPVILLVGAFDPLDEQEAQRVGADGVLKKPFVPPDPLISMVKSALTRSGVSLEGSTSATTAPPPPPPPPPVASVAKPEPVSLPKIAAPVATAVPEEDFVVASSAPPRAPLSIDKGAQPVAFGNLLDSPAIDEDAVFSIAPSAPAAPERDWGSANVTEEVEQAEGDKDSDWRLGSMPEAIEEAPAGQQDWREAAFAGIGDEKTGGAAWAPSIEKNSLSISEEEAAALAREQQAFSSPIGSSSQPDWAREISTLLPEAPKQVAAVVEESAQPPSVQDVFAAPPVKEPEPLAEASVSSEVAEAPAAPPSNPFASSWQTPANHPWEAALNRASELASSWDAVKLAPEPMTEAAAAATEPEPAELPTEVSEVVAKDVPVASEPWTEVVHEIEEPGKSPYASEPLLPPAVTEELPEEVAAVTESNTTASAESVAVEPAASEPIAAPSVSADELVAQVLAKMNPEVLQAVTREILKPIVQAMVKEQLEKK